MIQHFYSLNIYQDEPVEFCVYRRLSSHHSSFWVEHTKTSVGGYVTKINISKKIKLLYF